MGSDETFEAIAHPPRIKILKLQSIVRKKIFKI